MTKLHTYKTIVLLIILCLFSIKTKAQNANNTSEDSKLENVLKERKRLLKKGYIKNYFTIQVFSGDISNAKNVLAICKVEFEDRSQIFYETPNYKVQIGKYRNRLDADSALEKVAVKYPNAFVFKPKEKK